MAVTMPIGPITEVLTTMTCNQHKSLICLKSSNIITCLKKNLILFFGKRCICSKFPNYHMECINHGITCYIDITMRFFLLQVLCRQWSWSKVILCNTSRYLTIHFLWPWTIYIMCTESCLHAQAPYRSKPLSSTEARLWVSLSEPWQAVRDGTLLQVAIGSSHRAKAICAAPWQRLRFLRPRGCRVRQARLRASFTATTS